MNKLIEVLIYLLLAVLFQALAFAIAEHLIGF